MILLDEHQSVVHDEETEPSGAIKASLLKCNVMCAYADESLLYRFNNKGDLFLVSLSRPKFHTAHLSAWDLANFKKEHRVATEKFVVRDIGCGRSCVYLDAYSFYVPTELLLR